MSPKNVAEPKLRPSDRRAARRNGLPDPAAYAVRGVRIPLRDGLALGADLYTPAGASKGVLLSWGPYGRGPLIGGRMAAPWAAQGYTVLFASSRGTADSDGDFDPMRTEAQDGQDIVAWMREQDWYPGRFATVGGSYLGHTQWALLSDPPADVAASVVLMGPHDFSRHAWGTGTFTLDLIGWTEQTVVLGRRGILRAIIGMMTAPRRLRPVLEAAPVADAATAYFGDSAPWLRDRLLRHDLADPYWAPMQHAAALERADVPILVIAGWQDIFLRQSIEQFRRLRERGVETALTVGPWTHIDLTGGAARVTTSETLAWLDAHLAGSDAPARAARVRVFDKGADAWSELDEWPAASDDLVWELGSDGSLAATAGSVGERTFVYDPADPTPTVGGNIITGGGYVDDRTLAARADTLVYDTAPLERDIVVRGAPVVELSHASQHPDADLFVRVSDVDARGRSRNVTEGYVRVRGADGPVSVALLDTAHTFRAGHRVRLIVAGGSFPQFARSAGTGENPLTAASPVANEHRVAGGSLRLPVA